MALDHFWPLSFHELWWRLLLHLFNVLQQIIRTLISRASLRAISHSVGIGSWHTVLKDYLVFFTSTASKWSHRPCFGRRFLQVQRDVACSEAYLTLGPLHDSRTGLATTSIRRFLSSGDQSLIVLVRPSIVKS